MDDKKLLFDCIKDKTPSHHVHWRYYDGDHPIAFMNEKFTQVIKRGVVFSRNYCQVVVNATRDRMKIQSWNSPDSAVQDAMAAIWRNMKNIQAQVHVSALVTGEGYVVAWPDVESRDVSAYYHDPCQCHVLYEAERPDVPRVAVKLWHCDDGMRMNLYYTDRIEHYIATGQPSSASAFVMDGEPEANPYGVIPVFQFRISDRRCVGDLTTGVLSLQDAVNKLLNDMMVSSEYTSFPQRWGIGNWEKGPVLVGPGTMMQIAPSVSGEQNAELGAFPTTPPDNYLQPMDTLSRSMAVLSGTPQYYFDPTGGVPSGEALQAMEAPLIAKSELYQGILGQTWEALMRFCLSAKGITTSDPIEVIWQDPHTIQPQSRAQTRLTNTQAGIPIVNQLRDEGWTEDQIDQMLRDTAQTAINTTAPKTPEQAAPAFDGVVKSPDIAGKLAQMGALARMTKVQ